MLRPRLRCMDGTMLAGDDPVVQLRAEGPQRVVKQGGGAVVIVPVEDFERGKQVSQQPKSLLEFFQSAPTGGLTLDLSRKRDVTRKIKW